MPEMMAIGDSLFNGVRSLTIKEELAQWSAPAQVARALNIPFVTPNYPRYVVVDFEQWLHDLPFVSTSIQDAERNIAYWEDQPPSTLAAFDNIAIASTTYSDMLKRTWKTADAEINALKAQLGGGFFRVGPHLAQLFFAFNTRFLLNPKAQGAAPTKTSLEIVAEREPARLLVSIGANNGLWEMGFGAKKSMGLGADNPAAPFNSQDVADLKDFIKALTQLPPTVKHIYLNALPLPSQVANMMPKPDTSNTNKPGPGNYYTNYENGFGFDYGMLTAAEMRANDKLVRDVNALMKAEAAADARIHMVPIDLLFAAYDFKTDPNAKTVGIRPDKVLSNIMLDAPNPPFLGWRGGLMGLDGMHPSMVGYALMAGEILKAIKTHENIAAPAPSLTAAYEADQLLKRLPTAWDLFYRLQLEARRFGGGRPNLGGLLAAAPAIPLMPTTDAHTSTAALFDLLQFKVD